MKRKIARSMYNNPIKSILIIGVCSVVVFTIIAHIVSKRAAIIAKTKPLQGIGGRGGVNFIPTDRNQGTAITKAPISLYASPSA